MLRSRLDRAFGHYVRTGDPRALGRVFDGCAVELYRLAWHLLGDRHAAEDLVQQTFVVAIEQAPSFDGGRRVLPWLCGILTHRALQLRRQLRQRAAVDAAQRAAGADVVVDAAADAAARETAATVAASVRALPEPYRQVLLLHLVHELAPKEVAEALARPDATVRTQLARGLELLRKALPLGIGGFAAGCVPPPTGLALVRDMVMAHAGRAAAGGAAGTAGVGWLALSGVLAMKKVLFVVVVLLAVLCSWPWWGMDPTPPGNVDAGRGPAAAVAVQSAPTPNAASSGGAAADRLAVPAPLDPRTAGLDVLVLWHDGTPAADVAVRCRPRPFDFEAWLRSARTGDDGVAHLVGLPPGPANVLTGRGASADVELVAGTGQRVTIPLDQGIDVHGRVVDLDDRPIVGATVWMSVVRFSDDGEVVATSGPDGAFTIRGAGESFAVTATAPGFGCARVAWVRARDLVLTLRPAPGVLVGTVVDPAGKPVADARVLLGMTMTANGVHQRLLGEITGQDVWPSRFLRTDAEGRFRTEGLPLLPWPLWVGAPGFAAAWREVSVRADAETAVTVQLTHGAAVRGRITDSSGAPAAGAEVHVTPDLPAPHPLIGLGMKVFTLPPLFAQHSTTTDADGGYQLANVLPGKLSIHVWHRRAFARTECELADGQTLVWDAVVVPEAGPSGQPLHGVLVDEDGKPLESWNVWIDEPGDAHDPRISVRDGGTFRTNAVPPGRHRLFAQPRDPQLGAEVDLGEVDVADCPLRLVVPRAKVPTARLRGCVAPPAGAAGASCHVWVAGAHGSLRVPCDATGRYEAGPIPAGMYRVKVEGDAFGVFPIGSFAVVDGKDTDAGTFLVPTPGTLVVKMVDAAGRRVPDAWVSAIAIGGDAGRGGGLVHREGVARGNLPAGRWRLESRNLTPMAAMEVEVRSAETTDVRFVVPTGVPLVLRVPPGARECGRLSVRWLDDSGQLLREGNIYEQDAGTEQSYSAPAGRYTLEAVDGEGRKATTSFELRGGDPAKVVELPLPAR